MRAIIVEPSRFLRSVLASIFNSANIIVDQAESAAQGLELIAKDGCDILCFAQQLREGTGLDFLRQAKAALPGQSLVSLMVSADLTPARMESAARAGVTECFNKSRLDALEAFVKRFAESRQRTLNGHVLLVEDSIVAAKFCLDIIHTLGMTADHFDCAEKALQALDHTDYDIVLTAPPGGPSTATRGCPFCPCLLSIPRPQKSNTCAPAPMISWSNPLFAKSWKCACATWSP